MSTLDWPRFPMPDYGLYEKWVDSDGLEWLIQPVTLSRIPNGWVQTPGLFDKSGEQVEEP